jgi:Mn2+/Fe2+ NRAMP family transporter
MAGKRRKISFGPGFLVTAAFIGPGTMTTCTLAGARFGFALLYALVFATVTTLFLQEMTGRLSLGSGQDLGQALRSFPRRRLTRLIYAVLTLSAITFGCAAYEAGNITGGAMGLEILTPLPYRVWVVLIALAALLLLSQKSYKVVEKTLICLVFLMSLAFLTTVVIVRPSLSAALSGLVPTFPPGSLILLLALVGTTVVPYNLFLHSAAVKQKWNSPAQLPEVRRDLFVSIGLGGLISAAIVITAAVAFFSQGETVEKGIHMAQQLKPLFGSAAQVLFGLGFFAAGLSSAVTAPYAAAFASSGILGWEKGQGSIKFRAISAGVILIGCLVSLLGFNPLSVIIFAQTANGVILPVATVFLLLVLNNREKMGDLANTWRQNLIGIVITLIVSALGIWSLLRLLPPFK